MRGMTRSVRRRLGPVGLSLAAAAITAAGFAAFSLAADGDKGQSSDQAVAPGPPHGPGGIMFRAEGLSEEDQEKLENFRQCMEDQGLPGPPRFREGEEPPKPPSREELEGMREKLEQAHEACKDELPEEMRERGFPHVGPGPCGPPSGGQAAAPRSEDE